MKLEAGACCFVDFVVAGLFWHFGMSMYFSCSSEGCIFFCILLSQMFDHRGG